MGFVRNRRNYRLIFADEEFAGLEVVAKSASVSDYRRIAELATREFGTSPSAEDLVEMDNLYRAFAQVLVSWNLEEPEGVAVPATLNGLLSQDLPFVQAIVLAWMDAIAGVAAPLPTPSAGGDRFLEESLPMEVLSPTS